MESKRIILHPILPALSNPEIYFFWEDKPCLARENEIIASALIANGVFVFGHHPKDGSPQSIYCANGQCSQCMVIADGIPVKSCMEIIRSGMHLFPLNHLPTLPLHQTLGSFEQISSQTVDVLIIGGGPAGLSAAIELGKLGISAILVDDKKKLGGKLVLQTHRFFGSVENGYAGTRGIEIASKLEYELSQYQSISIWRNSTALAVFSDQVVGILKNGKEYTLVKPRVLLSAAGAREKSLLFKGNALPGVMGAGAFQTLVNRDQVRVSESLFIVGGGNVGLIAGYHALQAGIQVAGLVEVMPECGGYQVHKDKLARLGVPIHTSHTILSANGQDRVESVTIASIDQQFRPILGTEKTICCDSVLIAVGLDPVNEFHQKALEFGLKSFSAGDAEEIAEASAAMITGKIRGREIARFLGFSSLEIPSDWEQTAEILKSRPGQKFDEEISDTVSGVVPIIHCTQEIPCDPCSRLCEEDLIRIAMEDIREIPRYLGGEGDCKGCFKCLIGCPGLAITIVDYRKNKDFPRVSIPLEFGENTIRAGDSVEVVNTQGNLLGSFPVAAIRGGKATKGTWILQVEVPSDIARSVAGVLIHGYPSMDISSAFSHEVENETIVCRCERVTAREIRDLIHTGKTDVNEIKAICRVGMGACGGKTCFSLINRIFKEEGVPLENLTSSTLRPLFIEVPLSRFAGLQND
jgi:sarcosine oxidase subunit alpha